MWGAGVHVKSDTGGVYDESDGSQDEELHVVIDFTAKESQSQQHTMELVNYVNVDDEQNESDEDDVESGEECFEGNVVAVALMENPVCNATVLLVKLDFKALYRLLLFPPLWVFLCNTVCNNHRQSENNLIYNSLGQMVRNVESLVQMM